MEARKLWRMAVDADTARHPALAYEYITRYTELYSENVWGWVFLASLLVDLARYDEARAAFTRAFRIAAPEVRKALFAEVGRLYREQGDYRRALLWFRRAAKVDPNANTWLLLGGVLTKLGRFEDAKRCHRNALAASTECTHEAYLNLGLILRAQGRYDEALECFEKTIRLEPQHTAAKVAIRDITAVLNLKHGSPSVNVKFYH